MPPGRADPRDRPKAERACTVGRLLHARRPGGFDPPGHAAPPNATEECMHPSRAGPENQHIPAAHARSGERAPEHGIETYLPCALRQLPPPSSCASRDPPIAPPASATQESEQSCVHRSSHRLLVELDGGAACGGPLPAGIQAGQATPGQAHRAPKRRRAPCWGEWDVDLVHRTPHLL